MALYRPSDQDKIELTVSVPLSVQQHQLWCMIHQRCVPVVEGLQLYQRILLVQLNHLVELQYNIIANFIPHT